MLHLIKKIARDIALTLYDHPTEFICLSLARIWVNIFGLMIVVTWYREEFMGIKFGAWGNLTSLFIAACGAYGLKKWQDGKKEIQSYSSQNANMKE